MTARNEFLERVRTKLDLASAEPPAGLLPYAIHALFCVRGIKHAEELAHPAVLQIRDDTRRALEQLANEDAILPDPADWADATLPLFELPERCADEFRRSQQYREAELVFAGASREPLQRKTGRVLTSLLTARLPVNTGKDWTDAWIACGDRLGTLDVGVRAYRGAAVSVDPLLLTSVYEALA